MARKTELDTALIGPVCPRCALPATARGGVCLEHGLYGISPFEVTNLRRAPLLGHIVDGRYALVGHVGAGGMGAVYRAIQIGIGREVAFKILRQSAAAGAVARERFRLEAQVIAGLQSDYTVRVYDFGEVVDGALTGMLYMVMDLVEGLSLSERLKGGPLLIEEIALVLRHVANSVDEAHAKGIVHRDLKPSNILLTEHQGLRRAKVIDFGIARTHTSRHTRAGGAVGTPAYMAPELWPSDPPRPVDGRADVYAMGVVLYQLLTGRKPFASKDLLTLARAHRDEPPPPLAPTDDPISAFSPVVHRAMAKNPDERHPTLDAMAAHFERQQALAANDHSPTDSFTWTKPLHEPEVSGTSQALRGALEVTTPEGTPERTLPWLWIGLVGLGAVLGLIVALHSAPFPAGERGVASGHRPDPVDVSAPRSPIRRPSTAVREGTDPPPESASPPVAEPGPSPRSIAERERLTPAEPVKRPPTEPVVRPVARSPKPAPTEPAAHRAARPPKPSPGKSSKRAPAPGADIVEAMNAALRKCDCAESRRQLARAEQVGSGVGGRVLRDLRRRDRRCKWPEGDETCAGF